MHAEKSADALTLSIIIVSWNVCDLLQECLRSVQANLSLPPDEYEIIVVDNASDDGSVEMVRRDFAAVSLIANEENLGFGVANNQAFRACRGQWILLLNPDAVVVDESIVRMLDILKNDPEIGAVGARLMNTDGSRQASSAGSFPTTSNVACHYLFLSHLLPANLLPPALFLARDPETVLEVDWVSGACMMLRAAALERTIFDERFFMYGEDMELCARLWAKGWKVVHAPGARVVHLLGGSMRRQSSPEILSSALTGPRTVYLMLHGRRQLFLYDLSIVTGFLLRWGLYRMGAFAGLGNGLAGRARAAKRYAGIAWGLMRES